MVNTSTIKLILGVMLISMFVACGSAPITISGVVRDRSNGRELSQVKITTEPATLPTLTTVRGRFSIDRQVKRGGVGSQPIEPRTYTIIIEHEGYERYEQQIKLDTARDLELSLKPEKSIIEDVDLGVGDADTGPIHTGEGPRDDTM